MNDLAVAVILAGIAIGVCVFCGLCVIARAIDRWPNCKPCEGEARYYKETNGVH